MSAQLLEKAPRHAEGASMPYTPVVTGLHSMRCPSPKTYGGLPPKMANGLLTRTLAKI